MTTLPILFPRGAIPLAANGAAASDERRAGEDEGADGSCRENAGNRQRGMRMLMQMQRLGQAARLRGFSAREREEEEEEEEGGEGGGGGPRVRPG